MATLSRSPLTGMLSPDDHQALGEQLTSWAWTEGDPLLLAGDETGGFYLLVSGRVRVTRDTADGREITVDIAAPGDIVGPLHTEPTAATDSAWAMETSCALYVPADRLAHMIEDYPPVALALLQQQQERLTAAREREIGHQTRTVEQRVAAVLRELDRKLGSPRRDGSRLLQVRLRRDDIAGMAGTTVESASRAMSRMKKSDIIDSGREWVSIIDPDALDKIISGEPY